MKIQISFFIILFFTSCNVRERPFVITKNYIVSYVKTNRFQICKYKNHEEYKKRLVDCCFNRKNRYKDTIFFNDGKWILFNCKGDYTSEKFNRLENNSIYRLSFNSEYTYYIIFVDSLGQVSSEAYSLNW